MDTSRLRIGTTAAAVLFALAATASCEGDSGSGRAGGTGRHDAPALPATSAPATSAPAASAPAASAPATSAPATSAPPTLRPASDDPAATPPAHTDTAACFDGSCEITVTKPTTIRVDAGRFGFPSFTITRIAASGVTIEVDSAGTFLQSGVSQGGTAALNALRVRVESLHDGTADLALSHT